MQNFWQYLIFGFNAKNNRDWRVQKISFEVIHSNKSQMLKKGQTSIFINAIKNVHSNLLNPTEYHHQSWPPRPSRSVQSGREDSESPLNVKPDEWTGILPLE